MRQEGKVLLLEVGAARLAAAPKRKISKSAADLLITDTNNAIAC